MAVQLGQLAHHQTLDGPAGAIQEESQLLILTASHRISTGS